MRSNLLFSSVGDRSRHASHWLKDADNRTFDLVLCYYGDQPGRYASDADAYFARKGSKLGNAAACMDASWNRYRYIAVLDDDIEIDTHGLNRLFAVCDEYEVDLAQPAFTRDSQMSHGFTRVREGSVLRVVPFVEVGVTVFSARAFALCRETFPLTVSGYGQDFVWAHLVPDPNRIVVVDAAPCRHPRRSVSDTTGIEALLPRALHCREAEPMMARYGVGNPMSRSARMRRFVSRWIGRIRGTEKRPIGAQVRRP